MSAIESTRNTAFIGAFLPARVRDELVEMAERIHRSLSGKIRYAVTRHLEQTELRMALHKKP